MSQASHISRYRPAVIAVTGVAAAFGIWTLYSTFADQSAKAPLHRSNAVRRSRRLSVDGVLIESIDPTRDEPFGSAVIKRNNITIGRIIFGQDSIPGSEEWQLLYGNGTEFARDMIAGMAIQSVLQKARQVAGLDAEPLRYREEVRQTLAQYSMEDLGNAIAFSPTEAAQRYRSQLISLLGSIGTMDFERLFQNSFGGFDQFLPGSRGFAQDTAETEADMLDGNQAAEPAQGLKGLLYYIAEEKAKRESYEHRGIRCDSCNESPIRGIRWHCLNCPDVDLCSVCEASFQHQQTHVFVKIKIPLPAVGQPGGTLNCPVWYPGNPHMLYEPIQPSLRKRLAEEYHYEEPQIDALYDQFITTANVPYDQDPSLIKTGIDRRAFDSALTIKAWSAQPAPNVLYDRMFAFYDSKNKGVILFEDFMSGMAYLRGPKRFMPLKRALQGFDIDADGFVDRTDFIHLMRAKYDVQKELIAGASAIRADKISQEGADVLRSSQPISAIFCEQDMPQGEQRSSGGKQRNADGDLEPSEGTKAILEDHEVPSDAGALPDNVLRVRSLPHLQRQLARLDRALQHSEEVDRIDEEEGPNMSTQERANFLSDALSNEEATILGVENSLRASPAERDGIPSARQDALWAYTAMSYNEALDPLFRAREKFDQDVSATADERKRWRKEIDEAVQRKKDLEEQLRAGADLDPLVAAAAHSYDQTSRSWMAHQQQNQEQQRSEEVSREIDIQMRDNILPTDTPSLDQFEADIQEQSLEELLAAAGYSVDTGDEPDRALAANEPRAGGSDDHGESDSTLPHMRPNNGVSSSAEFASTDENFITQQNGEPVTSTTPPSQQRLEYLASLDEEETLIKTRGGEGRMSFDEIEKMASSNRETKGLITSWLELASF